MRFTLTIDCDNAAFQDGQHTHELARILAEVTYLVGPGKEWRSGNVRDINGNAVGTFEITEDDSDGYELVGWVSVKLERFIPKEGLEGGRFNVYRKVG